MNYIKQFSVILLLLVFTATSTFAGSSNGNGSSAAAEHDDMTELLQSYAQSPLSSQELDGILLIREEEKLARDVYLTLYDKWQIPIFNNILLIN